MTVESKGQGSTSFGHKSRQGPLVFSGEFPYHIDTSRRTHRSEYEAQNFSHCHCDLIAYVHTYIHMYILWIHMCVSKTAGYGTSNKYTNIQIYSVKYHKQFGKQYYKSSLKTKHSFTE